METTSLVQGSDVSRYAEECSAAFVLWGRYGMPTLRLQYDLRATHVNNNVPAIDGENQDWMVKVQGVL